MFEKVPYLKTISFSYKGTDANIKTHYPYNLKIFKKDFLLQFHKNVTFLVGNNGSGKSTIINIIAKLWNLSEQGGNRNFNISDSNINDEIHMQIKCTKSLYAPKEYYFLRAESFFNVASYMDEVNYLEGFGNKSLHKQSHGESFLSVLEHKLEGRGFYLFDEPESALSPENQLRFLSQMHNLVGYDSQFIIATHSPILLAYPNAKILAITDSHFETCTYTDTENYTFYKSFLTNHSQYMKHLGF